MPELAVLTGDIVRSQRLSADALDAVFQAMSGAADRLETGTGQAGHFTRARGDGWQMVTLPRYALRAACLMRAAVRSEGKGLETRLALSIGAVDLRGKNLSVADGPGLVASGQTLDEMGKRQRIAFRDVPALCQAALILTGPAAARWTARQAQVVVHALSLPHQETSRIAQSLSLSQQGLQKFWSAAHVDALREACLAYEAAP